MDDREAMRKAKLSMGLLDYEDLVRRCRSYRRFDEEEPLDRGFLLALVDLARRCASAGNAQPLRYGIVSEPAAREALFAGLGWAAALPDWQGPEPGERPEGYIVVFSATDPTALTWCDCGIACQTMDLAATTAGVGACMMRSFDPKAVRAALPEAPEELVPLLVMAFGYPGETVVLENLSDAPKGTTYWRGPDGVHHVPKRSLDDVLV